MAFFIFLTSFCLLLYCSLATGAVRQSVVEDVILKFFNGTTINQYTEFYLPNAVDILSAVGFDKSKPTVFYIHGFQETPDYESFHTIIPAYLEEQPDTNLVIVDWYNMCDSSYITKGAPNTKVVGKALAAQLNNLINSGLPLTFIHLVGHSLGAQLAGFAGRFLKEFGKKLMRVTGLDPAIALFYPGIPLGHMSDEDAVYVDIIHTDSPNDGLPAREATADFWPNGGSTYQPGCRFTTTVGTPEAFCSHWRSWKYWAESIRNPSAFQAVPFHCYTDFKLRSASYTGPINQMGHYADQTKSGSFYLQTNAVSPYNKGQAGISYQKP